MRKALIVAAAAAIAVAGTLSEPAHAGGSRGGAVAAGVIGGLAVGALVGAAAAQPRYYGPPPAYYAEPEPVYMAPPPRCYWTRGEPAWDGYRGMWVRPRVQVCD